MEVQATLCDFAEVSGGKLFISGAAINRVGTPVLEAPHPVQIALALLVTVPWTSTNQTHRLTVELLADSGGGGTLRVPLGDRLPTNAAEEQKGLFFADFNVGRAPQMQTGEESLIPLAMPMMGLPLPQPGEYFFVVKIDGTDMARTSFRLLVPQLNMMGTTSFGPPPW